MVAQASRSIKFFKVTALPAKLEPDGIYLLKTGTNKFKVVVADMYGRRMDDAAASPGTASRAFAMMLED